MTTRRTGNVGLWEKLLMGVVNETKRGRTNPKRMRGLVEVN
jgi:hypothetical protein